MSIKSFVKQMLVKKLNRDYQRELAGKKCPYEAWAGRQEGPVEVHATEEADDFVVFAFAKGCLSESAAGTVRHYMREHGEILLAYGDEDFMELGKRCNPWYKPAWSPDLYQEFFYPGSVLIIRTQLLDSAGIIPEKLCNKNGISVATVETVLGLRKIMDAIVPMVGGFERGCNTIGHVAAVLFHGSSAANITEFYNAPMKEKLPRASTAGRVSVIIPSKNNPEVLEVCLASLDGLRDMEIIVVDNGSSPENRGRYESLLKGHKYIYEPMEFDFSAMCNLGVSHAAGEYLLFLNDDMETVGSDWLEAMKEKAALPYVGAVGLKLYYPASDTIQHIGVINLPVGPVHKCQFASDGKEYYFGRNKFNHNCIAVTGACLLIQREKYSEAGGFKSVLPVAYNDVELGFALHELGYRNVVVNKHYGYHHESLSRGNDEHSREKLQRLLAEREKLYELHPAFRGADPFYPEGLSSDGLDSRFVPAYYSAGNILQKASFLPFPYNGAEVRVDRCVMASADTSIPSQVRGYGVVLGDDNACYDRYLVLAPRSGRLDGAYLVKLTRQYRQDLEENMPDQKNVALSGFWVECADAGLPAGAYEVAVLAVHRINKGKLLNYTNRRVEV